MTDPLTRVPGIWRGGMLTTEGYRVVHIINFSMITPEAIGRWLLAAGGRCWHDAMDEHEIALDDPSGATTGCLAAVCRELYGDPCMYALCNPGEEAGDPAEWQVRVPARHGSHMCARGPTEPAAWRAAILAHPSLAGLR